MSEPIKLDTLVELQDQYSDVYPRSPTAARGWVRARREFPKLDPEVYIEWDKSHWRYHGEIDGWTFEHHFRPVDDAIPEIHPDMTDILTEAQRKVELDRCPDCGEFHHADGEDYINTLMEAQEEAVESDGYFIITLAPRNDGDLVIYEPKIFSQTLTESAQKMIEAQLISLAAQLYQADIIGRMQELEDGR